VNGDEQPEKPEQEPKQQTKQKTSLIIACVVVIVLICVAAGGWLYVSNLKTSSTQTQAQIAAAKEAKSVVEMNQTVNKAQALAASGNQKQAVAVYNSAIDASSDPQSKAFLLLNEATTYYNGGNYTEALSYALQSEGIDKNSNIEQFIAQVYVKEGNDSDAIKYYQNAITYTNKSQTMAQANIESYQNIIKSLGGTVN
jgi:tetratricopeptide (TPR) repeat protein